jgi:hypothetical protein
MSWCAKGVTFAPIKTNTINKNVPRVGAQQQKNTRSCYQERVFDIPGYDWL